MTTRKDFVAAAAHIAQIRDDGDRAIVAERMADTFTASNPRFDRDRFYAHIEATRRSLHRGDALS